MKYTDGINTVDAVQYQGIREDMLNLQHIGFAPLITDLREPFNPKLRVGKNSYIERGDYVVRTPNGKFIGVKQSEFLEKYQPEAEESKS